MKSVYALLVSFLVAPAFAAPSVPNRPPTGHPLLGKWQWTRGANKCTETYDFRPDGTAPVLSGTEKTENVFTVAASPDANGFYRMTIRTTKDHGGKDCANDDSDSTGLESTVFLLFSPKQDQHLSCYEAKLDKCFGPLRKVEQP
jgi:hypothetical protein